MRLPPKCLVVLVGPSGAGKSHWAALQFRSDQVVSSDALRALVGEGEGDQRAGTDAFTVLDLVLERRLRRGLLTVVDTLGLDADRRRAYLELAGRHGLPAFAVLFDTPPAECRSRNRRRSDPVPSAVLTKQLATMESTGDLVRQEGFAGVFAPEPVDVVAAAVLDAPAAAARQQESPRPLEFGLQISSFAWPGGAAALRDTLAEIAAIAEGVGFTSLWVMDHVIQIPQVGRPWEDIPESWSTLAWLAARTESVRLGTLVSPVTFRNPAHLAKIVATADVLSGGRVTCGLGVGWWQHEHDLYGWSFPPLAERYALLEDTLQLLPLMWGPGSPPFSGRVLQIPETVCYPRPLQEHVPILVGGSGERVTLRLAARYADACNLFGAPEEVRRKVAVLASHCAAAGRATKAVQVTHFSTAVAAPSRREVDAAVTRLGGPSPDAVGAATIPDQIGRYRELAEAGVQCAIVALPDVATPGALEAFGTVIEAFRGVRL
jgi:F420-dependent oxidoreductase-like protein